MPPSAFLQATFVHTKQRAGRRCSGCDHLHRARHHPHHRQHGRDCNHQAQATLAGRFEWSAGAVAVAKISSFFTLISH